jgi:hypothetical protein
MRIRSTRRIRFVVLALACLTGLACVPASGALPLALLIADGTKTFASTARVGALAGAIRATEAFDLSVCFTEEEGLYADPLAALGETATGVYDVVVILPRGLDDGTADIAWIVTEVLPWTSPEAWDLVGLLCNLVDRIFASSAAAVDPTEDLWPAFLASAYRAEGWLR